jgi:hypothetical protein
MNREQTSVACTGTSTDISIPILYRYHRHLVRVYRTGTVCEREPGESMYSLFVLRVRTVETVRKYGAVWNSTGTSSSFKTLFSTRTGTNKNTFN